MPKTPGKEASEMFLKKNRNGKLERIFLENF